jgi:regulator of replication initiation timing
VEKKELTDEMDALLAKFEELKSQNENLEWKYNSVLCRNKELKTENRLLKKKQSEVRAFVMKNIPPTPRPKSRLRRPMPKQKP